jgi:O-antigen/teichoic acid export membrane protein
MRAVAFLAVVARNDDVTGSRLVRNTAVNGVASAVVAVLAVLMTPFFLRRLGPAEYGVWLLALSLTFSSGYLGLADLGLQQAGVRLIAEARSRGDFRRVSEVVSTMTALFVVLGVGLAVVLVVLAGVLADVFRIEESLESTARLVFMLVGLQILVDLPAAAFMALVEGAQRYTMLRVLDVGTRVVWSAAVAALLMLGGGAASMAVAALATAVAALVLAAVFARRVEPDLRLSPALASRGMLSTVVRQGPSSTDRWTAPSSASRSARSPCPSTRSCTRSTPRPRSCSASPRRR